MPGSEGRVPSRKRPRHNWRDQSYQAMQASKNLTTVILASPLRQDEQGAGGRHAVEPLLRPPTQLVHAEVCEALNRGEETLVEIARTYNVSHMTICHCYLTSAGPRQAWVCGLRTRPLPQPPTRSLADTWGIEILGTEGAIPAVTTVGKAGLV